ncbi:MAG: hypothetical protein NTV69_05650 [Caldilinea sp.]|nr:hypothetical protein [Caldilinea sp.]
MEGASRVGAEVFYLPAGAAAAVEIAEVGAGGDNALDLLLQPGNRKVEIDKAGAGDFDGADRAAGGQVVGDALGDRAWVAGHASFAQGGGGDQGEIGAVVAVVGLFGAEDFKGWQLDCWQLSSLLGGDQCLLEGLLDFVSYHVVLFPRLCVRCAVGVVGCSDRSQVAPVGANFHIYLEGNP